MMDWNDDDVEHWRSMIDRPVLKLLQERERTFTHDAVLVRIETGPGCDTLPDPLDLLPVYTPMDLHGRFPVLGRRASAAYTLAAAIDRDLAESGEAAVSVIRIGDTILVDDVLDRLHAAGCWVEETGDRITIHMPNSVEIPGVFNVADAFPPKLPAEQLRRDPDYLRHDPTKQHSRRRKRR